MSADIICQNPPLKGVSVTRQNVQQMICVRIFGGLGNQMFQYAAGLAQAERLGLQLILHLPPQAAIAHAAFGLNAFPIKAAVWEEGAPQTGLLGLVPRLSGAKRRRKTGRHWPGNRFVYEGLAFENAINHVTAGTYLSGYFQSERYFVGHVAALRKAFCLDPVAARLTADVTKVLGSPAPKVSVHIRRGDYVNDPKTLAIHGLIEDAYYLQAKKMMEQLYGACCFVIFSDDLAAADHMTKGWSNRLLVKDQDRFADLYAMSCCDHHIIANSSFSWWGAWLNASDDKTVIAPRRWFAREALKTYDAHDICPDGWVLI